MNSINPYLIRHFWILLITIRRNRSGKGKERLFPREIIDDRTRNTNTTVVRSPANEGCEASKGEERFEPHNTSPAMLVDPRYSIETEHYSFIVSPLHRVQYSCSIVHEDFVVSCDTCNALSDDTLTRNDFVLTSHA